jgi:hypothetical protein
VGGIKKGDVIKTEYYVRYDECPNDLNNWGKLLALLNAVN